MPFDARRVVLVSVSNKATVQIEGALYSVPSTWARLDATAYVGVEDVTLICRAQEVRYPKERAGVRRVHYRNYLPELARKPQAVRQVAPQLIEELGEPFAQLWQLLVQTHGAREASRVFARFLGAVVDHGEEAIGRAIKNALARGSYDLLSLGETLHASSSVAVVPVPESLQHYEVEAGNASDYDWLLTGGAQ